MSTEFKSGDRVIYIRLERPFNRTWTATYMRSQVIAGKVMYVIRLDSTQRVIQVGVDSIRADSSDPSNQVT